MYKRQAQIVTIGPIIREMVEENVEGSEEDMYTLRLRNATFSDAMGVFGSQLIPWHVYICLLYTSKPPLTTRSRF